MTWRITSQILLGLSTLLLLWILVRGDQESLDQDHIQKLQVDIDLLEKQNQDIAAEIQSIRDSINLKKTELLADRQLEITIKHNYEKVPAYVNALSNDELRREYARFPE